MLSLKCHFVVLACSVITIAYSQTQRLELCEEFTGENCGPCASVNTGLTKLITKNQFPTRKIVLLRYQCKIPTAPGIGSLYKDNPSEVDARTGYYSVPFAPYARIDGDPVPPNGNAGSLNQTIIDSRYLVNSPFSILVTHSLNNSCDSITVNLNIQAFQNYTPVGALKLRCALTEEFIHFDTPPGSNGEKDFEFIMRKMLPDDKGTNLIAGTWTNGQTQLLTLKAKIPGYIKNKPLMAVVAFIQDDGNKKVLNTAYSEPVPLPFLDISMNSVSEGSIGCIKSFSPVVELKNSGTPVITSAVIDYTIDNGSVNTFKFNGAISPGAKEKVVLPSVILNAPGKHFLTGYTWQNSLNDSPSLSVSGSASGGGAAQIRAAWIWRQGIVNSMTLPLIKTGIGSVLNFYLAAAPMEDVGIPDQKMEVFISKDCGQSWINVYSKTGKDFFTHGASSDFEPSQPSDWRKESIKLSSYVGPNDEIIVKFVVTSGKGINNAADGGGTNAIFIDDIEITGTPMSILYEAAINKIVVSPNPARNTINVSGSLLNENLAEVFILDLSGRIVYQSATRNSDDKSFDITSLLAGTYFLAIRTNCCTETVRFSVSK